jgi:hypothetical protein
MQIVRFADIGILAWPRHLTQAVDFQRLGQDRRAWVGAPRPGRNPNEHYIFTLRIKIYALIRQAHLIQLAPAPSPKKCVSLHNLQIYRCSHDCYQTLYSF